MSHERSSFYNKSPPSAPLF